MAPLEPDVSLLLASLVELRRVFPRHFLELDGARYHNASHFLIRDVQKRLAAQRRERLAAELRHQLERDRRNSRAWRARQRARAVAP
jgi:hypothetical protein